MTITKKSLIPFQPCTTSGRKRQFLSSNFFSNIVLLVKNMVIVVTYKNIVLNVRNLTKIPTENNIVFIYAAVF